MKRKLTIIIAIVVIIGGVFLKNFLSGQKKRPEKVSTYKGSKTVETKTVQNRDIISSIDVSGKLNAVEKVELFAEVNGTFLPTSKPFKEGVSFRSGEVLLSIDNREVKMNLRAQKSNYLNIITQMLPDLKIDYPESAANWEAYLKNFNIEEPVPELPEPQSEKERYFITARNIYNLYYSLKSQEERLRKYTIHAPFSGVIAESNINPGTLVRPGQKLGTFLNPSDFEMEVAVNINELDKIAIGNAVRLKSEDIAGKWEGTVQRISKKIDPNTQTVNVFIAVQGKQLKDGMFLNGSIESSTIENAYELERNLLSSDNKVFVVRDSILEKVPVEVVAYTEQTAIVRGIKDSTLLLRKMIPGANEGMVVKTMN